MAKKFSKPNLSRQINGDLSPTKNTPKDLAAVLANNQSSPDLKSAGYATNSTQSTLLRLDKYLADLNPEYSRATIQKFIKNHQATVNGAIEDSPKILIDPENDDVKIDLSPKAIGKLKSDRPPVLYEDDHVLVLNKPAGLLSVCKGDADPEPSLEDFGQIVHRLDRDTSGAIILAKDPTTASLLQKQFQQRKTHKTYYAIVFGCPSEKHAIINVPLTRNLKAPTTFMPDPSGREAITEYRVLETLTLPANPNSHTPEQIFSLLELKPTTGRTHQLRIHLAHLGTPIFGDPVYGNEKLEKLFNAPRMFLHASSLEITIPNPGQSSPNLRQTFTAPLDDSFLSPLKDLNFTTPTQKAPKNAL